MERKRDDMLGAMIYAHAMILKLSEETDLSLLESAEAFRRTGEIVARETAAEMAITAILSDPLISPNQKPEFIRQIRRTEAYARITRNLRIMRGAP